MKIFTLLNKNKWKIGGILFWIFIWELFSYVIGEEILFVSPISTFKRLLELIVMKDFCGTVFFSFSRIALGFTLAFVIGIFLSILSWNKKFIRILIEPLITLIQVVPVASFIIISLIWIDSKNLSIFISFLMVCPIIYRNTLNGIENTDKELLEMADVFKISKEKKVKYIYAQSVKPFLISACTVSLGLCFKAGIAAEVIGIPNGSLGEKIYESKIYLYTGDLFAWTIVIVLISVIFQRLFLKVLNLTFFKMENG
ncbi:ABC transporter permease subunit [uncultured Clostridium sp.]|uniref:ABC transporter permease n=1 Tax=uncultured Clostridium sp. TaxID=59620 RepID=UPI00261C4496|nr:ABC transporter permease subunit [uncultured Clostridium sp.]